MERGLYRAKDVMIMYKIYKIVCDKTDKVYVGRTKQTLVQRFTQHKSEIQKTTQKRL